MAQSKLLIYVRIVKVKLVRKNFIKITYDQFNTVKVTCKRTKTV